MQLIPANNVIVIFCRPCSDTVKTAHTETIHSLNRSAMTPWASVSRGQWVKAAQTNPQAQLSCMSASMRSTHRRSLCLVRKVKLQFYLLSIFEFLDFFFSAFCENHGLDYVINNGPHSDAQDSLDRELDQNHALVSQSPRAASSSLFKVSQESLNINVSIQHYYRCPLLYIRLHHPYYECSIHNLVTLYFKSDQYSKIEVNHYFHHNPIRLH